MDKMRNFMRLFGNILFQMGSVLIQIGETLMEFGNTLIHDNTLHELNGILEQLDSIKQQLEVMAVKQGDTFQERQSLIKLIGNTRHQIKHTMSKLKCTMQKRGCFISHIVSMMHKIGTRMQTIGMNVKEIGQKSPEVLRFIYSSCPPLTKIHLRIICKTHMNNGYCYLGVDETTNKILRPIPNISTSKCFWPKDYGNSVKCKVGALIEFGVAFHPDMELDFKTPLPHANEDLVINSSVQDVTEIPVQISLKPEQWSPKWLLPLACNKVHDIFPELEVKEDKYVTEYYMGKSVGILQTKWSNVNVYTNNFGKERIEIYSEAKIFDLPITAVEYDCKAIGECLVVLGLGRPYKGQENEYDPARCYILVLGFIDLPSE